MCVYVCVAVYVIRCTYYKNYNSLKSLQKRQLLAMGATSLDSVGGKLAPENCFEEVCDPQ